MKKWKKYIPSEFWRYSQSSTKRNIALLMDMIDGAIGIFLVGIFLFGFGATIYFFGKKLIQYDPDLLSLTESSSAASAKGVVVIEITKKSIYIISFYFA